MRIPDVFIRIRGGVAEVTALENIDVLTIDYDEPEAKGTWEIGRVTDADMLNDMRNLEYPV
jgi:hypothetical protein